MGRFRFDFFGWLGELDSAGFVGFHDGVVVNQVFGFGVFCCVVFAVVDNSVDFVVPGDPVGFFEVPGWWSCGGYRGFRLDFDVDREVVAVEVGAGRYFGCQGQMRLH